MSNFDAFFKSTVSQAIDQMSENTPSNLTEVSVEGARPFYAAKDITVGPGPIWATTFEYLRKGTPFTKFIDIAQGVHAEEIKRITRGIKNRIKNT